jgi:hypothetical protein
VLLNFLREGREPSRALQPAPPTAQRRIPAFEAVPSRGRRPEASGENKEENKTVDNEKQRYYKESRPAVGSVSCKGTLGAAN